MGVSWDLDQEFGSIWIMIFALTRPEKSLHFWVINTVINLQLFSVLCYCGSSKNNGSSIKTNINHLFVSYLRVWDSGDAWKRVAAQYFASLVGVGD
jgi:hypothetical protein